MKYRLLLSLPLLLPALASAEIYRWVDAQGHVQYTQTPPMGVQAQRVDPRVSPANPAAAEALHEQAKALDKAREEDAKKKAEEQAKAKQRAADCSSAQQRLRTLDDHGPNDMASVNAKGERERWTEEKFAEQRAQVQARVDKNCGSP